MLKRLIAAVCLSSLCACARGGGIGLQAMLADHNCEAAGYHLGTPQYRLCRAMIARQQDIAADAMINYYTRQQAIIMQQIGPLPRTQTCTFNSSTAGIYTNGIAMCQ